MAPYHSSIPSKEATASNGHIDCMVVCGDTSSQDGSQTSGEASSSKQDAFQIHQAAVAAAAPPAAAAAVGTHGSAVNASKPRTYYVDWLRVFLTLLVVCHHCVSTFSSNWTAWAAKPGDTAHWLLSEFFVNGNQTYFMTLFFFIAGMYVPGSLKRKGSWRFLFDRTVRLMLPCLVYSLVVPPLTMTMSDAAKNPATAKSMGEYFQYWFTPGWPSTYVLPTGPPWFLWMLWWFNVAYVILSSLISWVSRFSWLTNVMATIRGSPRYVPGTPLEQMEAGGRAAAAAPARSKNASLYTDRQGLAGGAVLIAVLTLVMYLARVIESMAFGLRPATFFTRGPFVSFMPDYFTVYVLAFGLGSFSGPSAWNVVPRLPSHWTPWLLMVGGIWWTQAGWVLNIMLRNFMVWGKSPVPMFLSMWALRTFVEQSFAVVWSVGLLILFRDAVNMKPGAVGQRLITGAYGAYLVHLPIVMLFARLMMPVPFPSAALTAAAIMIPSCVAAWVVAIAMRAVPGAHHVL